MTETTPASTDPIRVEVFLRTRTPPGVVERLRDIVARARRLEATETVTDVHATTWAPVRPALEAGAVDPLENGPTPTPSQRGRESRMEDDTELAE